MGFLNKSNAAPQRQFSIDSLVTDPSASTPPSSSEVWLSQYPNAPSHGDMPSPEDRHYLGKRSSVFKLRSRSNTSASTASSVSVSSTMLSDRGSQDFRHLSGMDFSGSKRSRFARGKKGKRLSDAVNPGPEIEEVEEEDGGSKRISVLRKMRRNTNQSDSSLHRLKHRISSPFDFQHLTHSEKDQFGQLEGASQHELAAEYWAVRAGQAPRSEVRGMKTEDLNFLNFSSENLTTMDSRTSSRTASTLGFNSPPQSPEPFRPGRQQSDSPESCRRTIRPARSVDSFSQPGIPSHVHRHTQSATPSPRIPSFQTAALLDESPEDFSYPRRSPRSRSNRASGIWDRFAPGASPPVESKLETIADEQDYFGHAVTTPDDSAIHPMSPTFTPDLEDVAEEPERFVDPRPAPLPPVRSPLRSPLSPPFSPHSSQRPRVNTGSSYASPTKPPTQQTSITRPISQMSDTLGSPTFPRRNSILRPAAVRRRSNTWRVIEESWEDDVDYIYENALEADCDFDWEHASDDGVYEDRDRTPEQEDVPTTVTQRRRSQSFTSGEEPTMRGGYFHGAFRPSLLVPSHITVPGLESGSAISASTADTGIQTPSDFFSGLSAPHLPYAEGEGFLLSPSLLVPAEYKENSRDDMYHGILSEYEGSDRHFPIIDANQSVSSSTRSSRIRSSKRSSYDSSLMSSATSGQGSGSFGSPIRRSASSSGSIPELVHSRRSRKDFSVIVDKLSEQVASFGSFGEDDNEEHEDDDTTPPGRAPQNITFFAASDDEQSPPRTQAFVENDVKASLELARHGSTNSARAPAHHRHVASDGAAKLLASVSSVPELKQAPNRARRARASSSPYLSLFPTPPRHTPVHSPISPNMPKDL